MRHRKSAGVAEAAVVVLVLVAGCGGETSRSGSDAPGAPQPSVAATAAAPAAKMSINGSSAKDLAAALRANGVDDPEKWARLIVEHAPYPPNDPGLTALRQVLTGAQADPHTVDQIVAVLRP